MTPSRAGSTNAPPGAPALELRDVRVVAGDRTILDDVNLALSAGRIVAIVGPNGAGKTTLLDAVSNVLPAMEGSVAIDGDGASARPGLPRAGVGRVFQGSPLPATLTVAEVASLVTSTRDDAQALLARFGLAAHGSLFASELSTGMRRILDLAVAAASSPPVLLLDEPASGLAHAEIEHLAGVLLAVREQTGAAIVMVEHDASLVRAVADEVVLLEAGRIAERGSPATVLRALRTSGTPRVRDPAGGRFADAIARVHADARPATPPPKRTVSTWTVLRLGLREFAAGLSSVLLLGVLNRVLKVELGISLAVVAALLASYNLAAPLALAIGYRSDTRPIMGRKRTPYILGGAVLAGLALVATPHVATRLAGGFAGPFVLLSLVVLVAMGVGMYASGAVFFALLADLVPDRERGHAISLIYMELMAGVMAGVLLTSTVIEDDASNLGTLFAIAGVLVVGLTAIATWGQEPRGEDGSSTGEHALAGVPLLAAIRSVFAVPQSRAFFAFMTLGTVSLFLQQSVLEPFGGDVLGLGVRATSAFNAVMTAGVFAGMFVSGRRLSERIGNVRLARYGIYAGIATFGLLAVAAATGAPPPSWLAIFGVGIASGAFSVAGLALMMQMADPRRTALFMGAWTIARAIADATAVAGGGGLFEVARTVSGSTALGYAFVFAVEAGGLALCLPLLRRVHPERFREEIDAA